jgi:hypothetical protein
MFHYLWKTALTFTSIYVAHDFVQKVFPEYYLNSVQTIFFDAIWYYSWLELKFLKYRKTFDSWFSELTKTYPILSQILKMFQPPKKCIEYVKDGNVVYSCTRENYSIDSSIPFDFIVYTSGIDKILYYKEPDIFDEDFRYNLSLKKFLMVEINFKNNEKLALKFKNEEKGYNYMIVENVIDRKFLTYFLRNHYLDEMYYLIYFVNPYSLEGIDYTLKVVDSNAQITTYGPEDSILL